jgi:hypothetical protein
MNLDAIFFLVTVAAILGQFSDVRTTDVALQHGFVESNLIAYAFKCGVLPFLGVLPLMWNHEVLGVHIELGVAVVGFVFGIWNYLKLRKAKVSFSEIFGL